MKDGFDNKFFKVFDFGNWPISLSHLFLVILVEAVIQLRIGLNLRWYKNFSWSKSYSSINDKDMNSRRESFYICLKNILNWNE
jgi:hypothetical protein